MSQLVYTVIYMVFIVYFTSIEIRSLMRSRWSYFLNLWSYVDLGIIACSWAGVGVYIWRYREATRVTRLLQETNGYVFVNLQMAAYINETFIFLLGLCCFFGSFKLIRICRFHRRMYLFIETIQHAAKELALFASMFAIIFTAFLMLFFLLFSGRMWSCSSMLHTAQMLFEIMLMKFDSQALQGASPFLGPFCFSFFVVLVVFICMSMFISIISDSFRAVRDKSEVEENGDEQVLHFAVRRIQRALGLRVEEQDARLRLTYYDPIEHFPEKIDQLFGALGRVRSFRNVIRDLPLLF